MSAVAWLFMPYHDDPTLQYLFRDTLPVSSYLRCTSTCRAAFSGSHCTAARHAFVSIAWAAHVAHCRQTFNAVVWTFRHSGARLWTSERWYVGQTIFESQSASISAMV